MEIARILPFSSFLFLLSGLLAVAGTRAESRYSVFWSRQAYKSGVVLAAAVLLAFVAGRRRATPDGFLEGVLLSVVLLGALYFVMLVFFRIELDAGFFSAVSLLLGLVATARTDIGPVVPRAAGGDLNPHTLFMFGALAALSLSFIFSLIFLIGDHLLKRKRIGAFFFRLPPLELVSRMNFSCLTVGTASLLAGVLAGLYDFRKDGASLGLLPVPTLLLSCLALALYGAVLFLRVGPLERRRGTAYVSIASYTFLLVTFVAAHAGPGA